jgi:hypothetical protein
LAAHIPAGLGVVAEMAVNAKPDVHPFPLREGVDDIVHDALGSLHPCLAAANIASHRAGKIENELQVNGADCLIILRSRDGTRWICIDETHKAGTRCNQDQDQQLGELALHPAQRARQGTHRLTPLSSSSRYAVRREAENRRTLPAATRLRRRMERASSVKQRQSPRNE